MVGSEFKATPVIVLPTVAFIVCSSVLVAVTSTVSMLDPISSLMSRFFVPPRVISWSLNLAIRNPVLLIVKLYSPGTTFEKAYRPASLVVAVREVFVRHVGQSDCRPDHRRARRVGHSTNNLTRSRHLREQTRWDYNQQH